MKMIRDPDDRLLTRTEVAQIFKVSPSTVTRWAEAGKLPVVKTLGGHRRYQARAVMLLAQRLTKEESAMEQAWFDAPAMFGDHHVVEVRRILLALPGVEAVNASSCFQSIEVTYDLAKTSLDKIKARLGEAGYLAELSVPVETGTPVTQEAERDAQILFRHTAVNEQAGQVISFAQRVSSNGPPLWSCPGIGVIRTTEQLAENLAEEATHG
jgi:excisionase family DNA binding protein